MIYFIIIFLVACFIVSIFKYSVIGKPYNGLFVLVSGLLFVGLLLYKFEGVNVETPWVKINKKVDSIGVDQKQIAQIMETTLDIIDLQRKIPKPTTFGGPGTEKTIKQYEEKIALQKEKLRDLINRNY